MPQKVLILSGAGLFPSTPWPHFFSREGLCGGSPTSLVTFFFVMPRYPWSDIHIYNYSSSWWFQTFFIFIPIWGRFPFWLIFFKGVETTNQIKTCCSTHGKNYSWWLEENLLWYTWEKNHCCCEGGRLLNWDSIFRQFVVQNQCFWSVKNMFFIDKFDHLIGAKYFSIGDKKWLGKKITWASGATWRTPMSLCFRTYVFFSKTWVDFLENSPCTIFVSRFPCPPKGLYNQFLKHLGEVGSLVLENTN